MDLIRSLAIAFSMYSRVPVPQVEWSERSMKYTFLFFPAVGLLEGALLLGIGRLLRLGGIAPLLRGAENPGSGSSPGEGNAYPLQ